MAAFVMLICYHLLIYRHEALERDDHEVIHVEVNTREDALGFRLVNMIVSMAILLEHGKYLACIIVGFMIIEPVGKVREVWICDSINSSGLVIRGVIDELKLVNGKIVVRDTKTRRDKTEPGLAQKRTSAMQLQTYRRMLDHIAQNNTNWSTVLTTFNIAGRLHQTI